MVEHNLDLMASADYIIDIGPEAGSQGGYLVAKGTPEEVSVHKQSHTAKYLREHLIKAKKS